MIRCYYVVKQNLLSTDAVQSKSQLVYAAFQPTNQPTNNFDTIFKSLMFNQ